ncbi:hypothetical protein DID80_05275 [Candidatus Marinamargulisbacteria bacterium SCGC AAA071-K20]|nr:hypothetical protein DID80_05275 [Candidatus Marinamargulisbacteria bacterium SCGC AAA071-K20]
MTTIHQDNLVQLLKKKGIGKTMSKSLNDSDCTQAIALLSNDDCSLTTKATLITALLCLDNNDDEQKLLSDLKSLNTLDKQLSPLLNLQTTSSTLFNCALQVISNSPLSYDDAKKAFLLILDPSEKELEKAILLEALRLKEESFDENTACLDLFFERANHHPVDAPLLIDIATPYDGFNRHLLLLPFVAALLGSLGFSTILHGLDQVSPKFGQTIHQLLKAAGKNPLKSTIEVANDLMNTDISWGYLDQSISFSELYDLNSLRKNMVKRPLLATMEKILQPLYSPHKNLIVTGYTHPAYKEKTVQLLQHLNKWDGALIVRGTEGSPQLGLDRRAPSVNIKNNDVLEAYLAPEQFNLERSEKIEANKDLTIENSLEQGVAALNGKKGFVLDSIKYQVFTILSQFNLLQNDDLISRVNESIQTKKALSHWSNF